MEAAAEFQKILEHRGLTGPCADVRFAGPDALMRRLARVTITETAGTGLGGRLVAEQAA